MHHDPQKTKSNVKCNGPYTNLDCHDVRGLQMVSNRLHGDVVLVWLLPAVADLATRSLHYNTQSREQTQVQKPLVV